MTRPATLHETGPGHWDSDNERWAVTATYGGHIATDFWGWMSFFTPDGLDDVARRIAHVQLVDPKKART